MVQVPYLPLRRITESFQPQLTAAVTRCVASGWYLRGEENVAFEQAFATYTAMPHCVGVANGLDALTLMLMAAKTLHHWADGDAVIVPAMTFVATGLAVRRAGLRPVFADVDATTCCLSPQCVEMLLRQRHDVRAMLPVHLYGRPADMAALRALAEAYGVALMSDAAQAHGAVRGEAMLGTCAAFSFYPGKNLGALGDGGAVVCADAAMADLIRMMANYGSRQKYEHTSAGLNSRLDEMQAAVLRIKLPRLDADNARRREIAACYNAAFAAAGWAVPYDGDTLSSAFHIYPLLTRERAALQAHLTQCGVQTLLHYPHALPDMPVFAADKAEAMADYSVSQRIAQQEISLPLHPLMTEAEVQAVIAAVCAFPLSEK